MIKLLLLVALAGALAVSHTIAFYRGKLACQAENTTAVAAAAQQAVKRNNRYSDRRTDQITKSVVEREKEKKKDEDQLNEAKELIAATPLPGNCDIPESERLLWNEIANGTTE